MGEMDESKSVEERAAEQHDLTVTAPARAFEDRGRRAPEGLANQSGFPARSEWDTAATADGHQVNLAGEIIDGPRVASGEIDPAYNGRSNLDDPVRADHRNQTGMDYPSAVEERMTVDERRERDARLAEQSGNTGAAKPPATAEAANALGTTEPVVLP